LVAIFSKGQAMTPAPALVANLRALHANRLSAPAAYDAAVDEHLPTLLDALEEEGWRKMPAEQGGVYPFTGARMIVGWDDAPSLPMHVELGRWRSGTGNGSGWCNTYGHPFANTPTHYWPLPSPPVKP
jgi:hypothetical protein